MVSRFERAASLVKNSVEQWGENGDFEAVISILRILHDAEGRGERAAVHDEIVDFVFAAYSPESVRFDAAEKDEPAEPATKVPGPRLVTTPPVAARVAQDGLFEDGQFGVDGDGGA
jgi:hypothetical protein